MALPAMNTAQVLTLFAMSNLWMSPLLHEHIKTLGRYTFSVPEAVAKGELRPLRNPADGSAQVRTVTSTAPAAAPVAVTA